MVSRTPEATSTSPRTESTSSPLTGESTDQKFTRIPRFELGTCYATAAVVGWAEREGIDITDFLRRHHSCDWGDLCEEDRAANENALECGHRILSRYLLTDGKIIYTITEADRSITTVLFASEY
jgi:hypothetical protein